MPLPHFERGPIEHEDQVHERALTQQVLARKPAKADAIAAGSGSISFR